MTGALVALTLSAAGAIAGGVAGMFTTRGADDFGVESMYRASIGATIGAGLGAAAAGALLA